MTDILSRIVPRRRRWIGEQRLMHSASELTAGLTRSDRDFAAALKADRPAFILEYKKASPSQGAIRPQGNLQEIA